MTVSNLGLKIIREKKKIKCFFLLLNGTIYFKIMTGRRNHFESLIYLVSVAHYFLAKRNLRIAMKLWNDSVYDLGHNIIQCVLMCCAACQASSVVYFKLEGMSSIAGSVRTFSKTRSCLRFVRRFPLVIGIDALPAIALILLLLIRSLLNE